ncbi:ceramide glucosyltransferase isoform X2 [Stigmatopora argus]
MAQQGNSLKPPPFAQEDVGGEAAGGRVSAEALEGRGPQPHLQPGDLLHLGLPQVRGADVRSGRGRPRRGRLQETPGQISQRGRSPLCRRQEGGHQPQDQQPDAGLRGRQVRPGLDLRQRHPSDGGHADGYDQSDDGEGGPGARPAVRGRPAGLRRHAGAGLLRDVAPALVHLGQRDGHQVRDGHVVPDAKGRPGPGGRPGGLRAVHRRRLLHGQSHRRQRLEVLHGDAGGLAKFRLLLHRAVPVALDQVDQAAHQHASGHGAGAGVRVLPGQPHHRVGRTLRLQVGHDGVLHVSLFGVVHRRLRAADRSSGRPPELLQVGLCRGLVHPRVHGGADLPVGAVGPHHQLADRPLPPPLRRHRRGDPRRLD